MSFLIPQTSFVIFLLFLSNQLSARKIARNVTKLPGVAEFEYYVYLDLECTWTVRLTRLSSTGIIFQFWLKRAEICYSVVFEFAELEYDVYSNPERTHSTWQPDIDVIYGNVWPISLVTCWNRTSQRREFIGSTAWLIPVRTENIKCPIKLVYDGFLQVQWCD